MHGIAKGSARVSGGALVVDGNASWVETKPTKEQLRAKTLEAWVELGDLNQKGGGVIGVQNLSGVQFDTIVFAERESRHWMAGSNG